MRTQGDQGTVGGGDTRAGPLYKPSEGPTVPVRDGVDISVLVPTLPGGLQRKRFPRKGLFLAARAGLEKRTQLKLGRPELGTPFALPMAGEARAAACFLCASVSPPGIRGPGWEAVASTPFLLQRSLPGQPKALLKSVSRVHSEDAGRCIQENREEVGIKSTSFPRASRRSPSTASHKDRVCQFLLTWI